MIGAGGLLWLQEQGYEIPNRIGLAGFNDVQLLQGLPTKLATMDSCRQEIGRRAAEAILKRLNDSGEKEGKIELSPRINPGDTLRLR